MSNDPIGPMPFDTLLTALASKTPAPGGGAAAAMIGATGAALAGMVVAFSLGRKPLAEHQDMLDDAAARLERCRALFVALADEDARAYAVLNGLMRLPEGDPARRAGWAVAVADAMAPPRAMLAAACDLLRLLEDLTGRINPHLRSDLAVAAVATEAAARGAAWNIRANLPLLEGGEREAIEAERARAVTDAGARAGRVEAGCV